MPWQDSILQLAGIKVCGDIMDPGSHTAVYGLCSSSFYVNTHTHASTHSQAHIHSVTLVLLTLSKVLLVRQSEKIYPEAWLFVLQRIYFHTLPRTEENSAEPTSGLNCTPEPVLFVRLQEGSLLFLSSLKASER